MPNAPNPSPIAFRPARPVALLAGLSLLSLGCSRDQVAHYRVPKERPFQSLSQADGHTHAPGEVHVDGEAMPPAAQDLPPAPKPEKGGLRWALPKGWSQGPGDSIRLATFKAPIAGRVEATVVVLPGPAGGELANVNRWRGQIALPPLDESGLAKARKVLKTKAGALNVYDFTSEGTAKSRVVAGYITTPDGNTWFLKLTGDADPVAKARPDFMNILESIRLD